MKSARHPIIGKINNYSYFIIGCQEKLKYNDIIKNISFSTSHKKNCETVRLRDFSFYLSSTFAYEPILIKKYMNANNMNILFK